MKENMRLLVMKLIVTKPGDEEVEMTEKRENIIVDLSDRDVETRYRLCIVDTVVLGLTRFAPPGAAEP
jgi:hypothetical protein